MRIDFPLILRQAGLEVIEVDGWQTRGRDLDYVAGVVGHHTATGPTWADEAVAALLRDGRPDLAGPLSQLGLDRHARYWCIASGRANHNGYGEWGNSSVGIEAYNDGLGEPWGERQYLAYVKGAAAILRFFRLGADRFKGHKETDPGRKPDPEGLDMGAMRGDVAGYLGAGPSPEEDTMAVLTQDEADKLMGDAAGAAFLANLLWRSVTVKSKDPTKGGPTVALRLDRIDRLVRDLTDDEPEARDMTEDEVRDWVVAVLGVDGAIALGQRLVADA